MTHYEAAVKLAPTDTAYRKAYANALRRAGAFKVAAAQYEEVFKTNPAKTQAIFSDLAEAVLPIRTDVERARLLQPGPQP